MLVDNTLWSVHFRNHFFFNKWINGVLWVKSYASQPPYEVHFILCIQNEYQIITLIIIIPIIVYLEFSVLYEIKFFWLLSTKVITIFCYKLELSWMVLTQLTKPINSLGCISLCDISELQVSTWLDPLLTRRIHNRAIPHWSSFPTSSHSMATKDWMLPNTHIAPWFQWRSPLYQLREF
jgi:hypothetical protein